MKINLWLNWWPVPIKLSWRSGQEEVVFSIKRKQWVVCSQQTDRQRARVNTAGKPQVPLWSFWSSVALPCWHGTKPRISTYLYFNVDLCLWRYSCVGPSVIRKPAMVGWDETLFSEVWEDSSSVFTRVVKVHSETLCQLHWDMKTVGFDSTFTSCIWTPPTPTTCFFSRRKYCWKILCLYSWFTRVNRHLLHSGGKQLQEGCGKHSGEKSPGGNKHNSD